MSNPIEELAAKIWMRASFAGKADIASTIRAHFATMAGVELKPIENVRAMIEEYVKEWDGSPDVKAKLQFPNLLYNIDTLTTALAAARARIAELEAGRNGEA